MGWRQNLRPASFRGVGFVVENRDISGGRRLAIHEYPRRDEPYPEDMGRKRHTFSVTAFQLGRDYQSSRDSLRDALEKEGPGEYVDPWGQKHRVVVASWSFSERLREGGYVSWRITFEESGEKPEHSSAEDTSAKLKTTALAAKLAVLQRAIARWDKAARDVMTQAGAYLDPLLQRAGIITQGIQTVQGILGMPGAILSHLYQAGLLVTGIAGLADLIATPSALFGLFDSLISRSVAASSDEPIDQAWYALRLALSSGDPAHITGDQSFTTLKERLSNASPVARVLAETQTEFALLEAAQAVADADFDTAEDALAIRDELCAGLTAVMQDAPDELYAALSDVRSAITADVRTRAADLATLKIYTPQATMPALLLAYKVYGTAANEDAILRRNRVTHPGFVPGGSPVTIIWSRDNA